MMEVKDAQQIVHLMTKKLMVHPVRSMYIFDCVMALSIQQDKSILEILKIAHERLGDLIREMED